jgi:hypothetical protein
LAGKEPTLPLVRPPSGESQHELKEAVFPAFFEQGTFQRPATMEVIMINRRRWLAAAAALAAGVFCGPGQALAGLFRRKCQPPPCPCPPSERDYGGYGPSISIQTPPHKTSGTAASFTSASGYFSTTSGTGWVKCYLKYADNSTSPASPSLASVSGTTWSATFSTPKPSAPLWAELHVELYDNSSGTLPYLDADLHLVKFS